MEKRIDPFELAEGNRASLRGQFDAAIIRLEESGLTSACDSFLELLEKWTVSINMYASDVRHLLAGNPHRNTYGKSRDKIDKAVRLGVEGATKRDLNDVVELSTGKAWYRKRKMYSQSISGEENIKYGAIYAGGEALGYYGHYRLVLNRERIDAFAKVFVLKADSLNYFLDREHETDEYRFDIDSFRRDLACRENVHHLAVIKHETDLGPGNEDLKERICHARSSSERCYMEVQIADEIFIGDVGTVGCTQDYYSKIREIASRSIMEEFDFKEPSDREAARDLEDFSYIHDELRKLGIEFEIPL